MTAGEQAVYENLVLAHNPGEAERMLRAAELIGASSAVVFDASSGDPEQITAGVAAFRAYAEEQAEAARGRVSLEMSDAPDPEVWAGSARRVLAAGGLVIKLTTQTPDTFPFFRMLRSIEESE